ncbi:MAG TPA: neutral/alkaline non-lysosomal ceramidase N-terminal domain-containing protein [Sedimentisphaerales bacterium]|nr:neutral/alkaline non-lysosomal ceramidase N-terminal domain-containing protein [Sedimentisphaerales bacterium]HRS10045.1 neutral/alkaline non-lysosomal ceramidase N-terminal domain-containing protein [Sedimentisphaerales bacterium]HRV46751.1 neutral/alkaline non-lysosomal ceramidase N-terminal domain-containing protein [Sedimentisphaerales bacterium]
MRRHPRITFVLLPVLLSLGSVVWCAEEPAALKVGAARVEITPEKPVQMAGYASRKDLSTGVHDPLSARVLAFEKDGKRLVLVSVDILGFYEGTADYFRDALLAEYDLAPSELFLCAIHTHSAPSPTLNKEKGHPNNVEYTEKLRGDLVKVVGQALGRMQPAEIGIGVGSCPVGSNRRELRIDKAGESSIVLGRNPNGPTDKEVLVMKISRPDGTPLAVAFDYATHATSLGPGNYVISGDVIGLAEQFVEKIVRADIIAPAFVGASGNIDPWFRVLPGFNTEPGWVPEPVLLGTFLGEEVVHVCRAIDSHVATSRIAGNLAVLDLPAKASGVLSGGGASTAPFVVTVARLGDIAFVGLGGEVLTEIGMAIKAGSPCRHTFVITHCNGAAGYLAPDELHVEGGYEVRSSRFAPQAADVVVRESIRLLHDL